MVEAVAVEHAECCICCEPLCDRPTAVLQQRAQGGASSQRTCNHFFHASPCAAHLANGHHGGKTCPVCRAPYSGILPVPSIVDDPEGWFLCVDLNGDGSLSQPEVREVTTPPPPPPPSSPPPHWERLMRTGGVRVDTEGLWRRQVLKAQLPIDWRAFEGELPSLWGRW